MKLKTAILRYLETLRLDEDRPLIVLPWQRKFVAGAFSVSGDAALSVARGNGKSALVAAIAAAVVDPSGPLHGRRREVVVCASAFQQSKIIFEDALSFLSLAGHDIFSRKEWRVANDAQRATVEHLPSGARLRCVGSDPKRAHGLRPALALLDEPAQWPAHTSESMLAAMRTSLGKVPGSRAIALGTRPASKLHWFQRMLDGGCDYSQTHTVTKEDMENRPFLLRTIRAANPSLKIMPDLEARIVKEAQEARHSPALLASYLALRLNGGVADVDNRDMVSTPAVWQRCLDSPEALPAGPTTWGVDLGSAYALSAVACAWETGRLSTMAMFGSDPDIDARAKADSTGDLYKLAHRDGELLVAEKRIPEVRELLREAAHRWGMPRAIVCDTWRLDELKDVLDGDDLPWKRVRLISRRQGFKDGSSAIMAWRKATIAGRVHPVKPCRLLTHQLGEAVTIADPAGNEKLARDAEGGRRKAARDDLVAASLLAIEFGLPAEEDAPQRRRSLFRVV